MDLEHGSGTTPSAPRDAQFDAAPLDATNCLLSTFGAPLPAAVRRPSLGWMDRRDEMEPLDELSATGLARCGRYSPLATEPHEDEEFSSELPALALDASLKSNSGHVIRQAHAAALAAPRPWPLFQASPQRMLAILAVSGWVFAVTLAAAVAAIYAWTL
ncbi:MAG TPA: hypothetical protein VGE52_03075 [Pirellulales bacterium]